ncbi:VanZ family protein [Tenuibacillus multivorans]|uniref:VanZ like family protein n=1 Tax=Tenuibacillus multivorans TaxID=237069 RepID=A0A1G9WKY3_9BACI|nr:VanZ family protein [Tenuibacillus multivorans]GEL76501.1 hypothetical protein TMU01_07360 [Tenuibacillus multivorans]SDM85007.1 VanZ like family protein [Tenuibacillus multivorans]
MPIIYSLIISQIIFVIFIPLWMQLTLYLHALVMAVIWFCLTFIGLFVGLLIGRKKLYISKQTLHFIMFVYSLALFALLFFRPSREGIENINLIPFNTIRFYLNGEVNLLIAAYNLGANLGLFIPFGIFYRYRKQPRLIQLVGYAVLGVCIIEGLQFFTGRGSLDIDDLILNVTGVMVGYLIYPLIHRVMEVKN